LREFRDKTQSQANDYLGLGTLFGVLLGVKKAGFVTRP